MLNRREMLTAVAAPLAVNAGVLAIDGKADAELHRQQDAGVLHEVANILEWALERKGPDLVADELQTCPMPAIFSQNAVVALRNAAERIKSQDYSAEIDVIQGGRRFGMTATTLTLLAANDPQAIIVRTGRPRLTAEQMVHLKRSIEQQYRGSRLSGIPVVILPEGVSLEIAERTESKA